MGTDFDFQVEFQILDNVVVTEKQKQWKRKFVSMDIMRLIRKALDKLRSKDMYWKDYKCFERSYGLTILSEDERKHLSLFPLVTAPCNPNCILFHQRTGRFRDWFPLERLMELSDGIRYEIEFFLHKKIPTAIKYPVFNVNVDRKPVMQVFQEQEPDDLPEIPNPRIDGDGLDLDTGDYDDYVGLGL